MKNSITGTHLKAICSRLLLAIVLSAGSQANATNWTGLLSTNWFFNVNWDAGVPTLLTPAVIDTVIPNTTTLNLPGAFALDLNVGQSGTGMLNIQNFGALINGAGTIGNGAGSIGTVRVTGATTAWLNTGALVVGGLGTGTLIIENGSTVTSSGGASIGQSAGSVGSVVVSGTNSTWINTPTGGLNIGGFGTGTLSIIDGGNLININPSLVNIGDSAGSMGTVNVSGANSIWVNLLGGNIGNSGTGTLTISNNSNVLFPVVTVAVNANSIGIINIGSPSNQAPVAPGNLVTPSIIFGNGTGNIVFNHTNTDYNFTPIISGGGAANSAVSVYNGTTVMLGASTYAGQTAIYGGTLAAGAANVFSANSNYNVQAAGTLDLRSNSQTLLSLTNAGVVRTGTQNGVPSTSLITSNYVGNNGSFYLNTYLGSDNSPSDLLIINGGNASGATTMFINNVSGAGALTIGNGILVVNAINGATTNAGAFIQGNTILAGPFEYNLYKGGLNGSDPNNWYLRSIIPNPGPIPPIPDLPSGFIPNYRTIVSLHTAIPSMALLYNQFLFDTLHQRMYRIGQFCCEPESKEMCQNAAWLRVMNENGKRKNGNIFGKGPDFDYHFLGLQGGVDLYQQQYGNDHSDLAGVFSAIGRNQGNVEHVFKQKAGRNHFYAYTAGVYWTHYGPHDWYVDGVLEGTFDRIRAENKKDHEQIKTHAKNWGASVAGGYPIILVNDFVLEPQAQISYQKLYLKDVGATAVRVHFNDPQSTVGKVGGLFSKTWCISNGILGFKAINAWLSANIWRQFAGKSTTSFSSMIGFIPFYSTIQSNWADVGVGFNLQVSKDGTVYFAYKHYEILNQGKGHANEGSVGMRFKF